MLTVSPDVADVTPCETDDDPVVGDPECCFAEAVGRFHVCTDRDGAVVTADTGKACWAWARRDVRTVDAVRDELADAGAFDDEPGPDFPPADRCEECGVLGGIYTASIVDPGRILCDGCHDSEQDYTDGLAEHGAARGPRWAA